MATGSRTTWTMLLAIPTASMGRRAPSSRRARDGVTSTPAACDRAQEG